MVLNLAVVFATALLATYVATPWVMRWLTAAGLVGADVNKPDRPVAPAIGGFAVMFGLVCGVLAALALVAATLVPGANLTRLLAAFCCVLLVSFIGVFDDLFALAPPVKGTLPAFAAIPLIAVAGPESTLTVPFVGMVDFGLLYPLVLIPIGVTGAANVTNMLAGFNGSEAGMGAVACLALAVVAVVNGRVDSAILLVAMIGALLAFLAFNWYPARIFIGDTGTLAIGTVLASAAVIGHFEAAGVIVIVPYAIDFVIKAANRFPSKNWWGTWVDGRLTHAGRPMGLGQAIMRMTGGLTEARLTLSLIGLEAVAGAITVIAFARA